MNLYTLDLVRTEKFLYHKFPSIRSIIRHNDTHAFRDYLEIVFINEPSLIIKLGDPQYKNGNIFYDYIRDAVADHLALHSNKSKQDLPMGVTEEVKFILPDPRLINENETIDMLKKYSRIREILKSDFKTIVSVTGKVFTWLTTAYISFSVVFATLVLISMALNTSITLSWK